VIVELEACQRELKGESQPAIPRDAPPVIAPAPPEIQSTVAEPPTIDEEPAATEALPAVPEDHADTPAADQPVVDVSRDLSVGASPVFSGFSLDEIPQSVDGPPVPGLPGRARRDWQFWLAIAGAILGTIGIASGAWMAFGR
jgi:hypothetical protein